MPLQPGATLLHYRLVEQIGEGGMGVVWRAEDTTLGRQVAIKILPERFAADAQRLTRFEREAMALAALNDPGIASIYSVHLGGEVPFLAMELVTGEALSRLMGPGGMPLDEALEVAVALADAVAAAHAAGIVHRDLKPDNVMLTSRRRVKVLDFGLAKLAADDEASPGGTRGDTVTEATRLGSILGTVAYMSPEQAEGLPVDARSDVFSLGTMLYEMLTGRRPFAGQTPVSTISAILRDTPRPVAELRQGVPAALAAIVTRCLEKDPQRRFADAGALRDALQQVSVGTVAPKPRRGFKLGFVVAVTAGLAAAIASGLWLDRRDSASGGVGTAAEADAAGRTVAVMGFENLSDPDDAEKLGRVLMGLVTTDLVESRGLDVLSTARVLAAIREAGGAVDRGFDLSVASRAATEAGADVMLVGQVNHDGERILLAAEMVDVSSGKTTGSIRREAGSSSELFALAGSIAAEIRRQLGVSTSGAGAERFDLAESLTSSPDAYRQYAAGELDLHLRHFAAASRHFEQAIDLDPSFALAYYRLGMSRSWSGQRTESREALARGLPHIGRLPEHWQRVYRGYIEYDQAHLNEAHEQLAPLADEQVPIADLYYVLSEIVTHSSRYWDPRRVRALSERALELDPTFATARFHLYQAYELANDRTALLAAIERRRKAGAEREELLESELGLLLAERRFAEMEQPFRELGSNGEWLTHAMVQAWLRTGQGQRAIDGCRAALADPDLDLATTAHALALALASSGRFDEARANLDVALSRHGEFTRPASSYLLGSVRIAFLTGDLDTALREAGRAVESDREHGAAWYWLGRVQIERGDTPAAARSLEDVRAVSARIPSPLGAFWSDLLATELQLARGEKAQALATLERIAGLPPEYRERPLEGLVRARVLAAEGNTDGAIAAYREVLDPPWLLVGEHATPWLGWPIYEIELLYPLAKLELEAGQTEQAREHFRAYVEHWGKADHPVVGIDDARAQLARATARK